MAEAILMTIFFLPAGFLLLFYLIHYLHLKLWQHDKLTRHLQPSLLKLQYTSLSSMVAVLMCPVAVDVTFYCQIMHTGIHPVMILEEHKIDDLFS